MASRSRCIVTGRVYKHATERGNVMKWMLCALGAGLILAGSWLASAIQTAGGIRVEDIRFAGTGGTRMSALLYIPPNATAATPAPGVLAVHGLINSREM